MLLLATLAALAAARHLRLDVSTSALVSRNDPAHRAYLSVREQFGSDLTAAVYVEDRELFTTGRLERLRQLHEALAALPFNERTDSLFSIADLQRENGTLQIGPLVGAIPVDPASLGALRARCLAHPLIQGGLLDPRAEATLLILHLAPDRVARDVPGGIADEIEAVVERFGASFTTIYQVGTPALQAYLVRTMKRDQWVLLPACTLVVMVLLLIGTRSPFMAILPVLNTAIATVWMFGAMAVLGVPVNLLNHIIPLLLLVMGSSEDVHLFHAFRAQYAETGDKALALQGASGRVGLGLLLSVSTTLLGFASVALSELPVLRDFAYAAAIGLACRFVTSCTLLPISLRLWQPRRHAGGKPADEAGPGDRALARAMGWLAPRSAWLWAGMILLGGAALFSARWIETHNDLLGFLPAEAPIVARARHVGATMGGLQSVYVSLRSQKGDFAAPHGLEQLQGIGQYLATLDGVGSARSFADVVARLHQQLRGGASAQFRIPSDRAVIAQMLLFVDPHDFRGFVTPDYSRANLIVRCHAADGFRLEELVATIRQELSSGRWGPLDFSVTGDAVLVAGAVDSITRAQLLSLGSSLVLIFVIVWLLFLSARCGLVTVAVNLFSSLMVFGLMGVFGVPLNVGTCMVAAITLGLAMNDTLHLLVRYNQELRQCPDEGAGMRAALQASWRPIIVTSLALAAGFTALGFSSFQPVQDFGLLSAAVIVIAMGVDLFITPAVVSRSRVVTLWDVLSPALHRSLMLDRSPFFRGLSQWQARHVVLASEVRDYAAGAAIFRAGEPGDTMFLILVGRLEVFDGQGVDRRVVDRLGAGEICGEVAFLAGVPRTFSAAVVEPARLLALNQRSLASLQRFSPYLTSTLLLNVSRILCNRFVVAVHREAHTGGAQSGP